MFVSRLLLLTAASLTFRIVNIHAQPVEIPGEETTLKGTTEGIISHRFQKHSWITPDGAFHALTGSGQYPQVSIGRDDSVHLFCSVVENGREPVRVLSSRDGGDFFTNDFDLMFLPEVSLEDRRLEAPSSFDDELPVLMLYEPSGKQRKLVGFLFENRE